MKYFEKIINFIKWIQLLLKYKFYVKFISNKSNYIKRALLCRHIFSHTCSVIAPLKNLFGKSEQYIYLSKDRFFFILNSTCLDTKKMIMSYSSHHHLSYLPFCCMKYNFFCFFIKSSNYKLSMITISRIITISFN